MYVWFFVSVQLFFFTVFHLPLFETTFNKIFDGFFSSMKPSRFSAIVIADCPIFKLIYHIQQLFFYLSFSSSSFCLLLSQFISQSNTVFSFGIHHNEVVSKYKLENWMRFFWLLLFISAQSKSWHFCFISFILPIFFSLIFFAFLMWLLFHSARLPVFFSRLTQSHRSK